MKITKMTELDLEDLEINISIQETNSHFKAKVTYSYTCPRCSGHGCKFNNPCSGTITENLDLSKLDKMFSKQDCQKIRKTLAEILYSSQESISS